MRSRARLGLLLCAAGSIVPAARAASVTFSPDPLVINPALGAQGSVSVSIEVEALSVFDAVDLVVASQDLPLGFVYSPAFVSATSLRATPTTTGLHVNAAHYVYVGGLLDKPLAQILLGSLTVDAAGLPQGQYTLGVDPALDGGLSLLSLGTKDEPLTGAGTVVVVPEPAGLALLGAGLACLCRRRGLGNRIAGSSSRM